jgi:N6-L-threonylcarbamoyladenine synthase
MTILSIETSCDETAVSIVEAVGDFPNATYTILGNALFSQVDIHREYGGVFPAIAKREHAKTLVPMLTRALEEAKLLRVHAHTLPQADIETLQTILYREPGLGDACTNFLSEYEIPRIDLIAVTSGPGLEPALWVGINFARALSYAWQTPLVPINHMEGHILSSIFTTDVIPPISFPALALLISGGHTELVVMKDWLHFEKIGETRDDAIGEAFDKVARMLGLPYPGGPEIGARAERARRKNLPAFATLPRPMIDTPNFEFSFSGLKTSVRYAIEGKVKEVNGEAREAGLGHGEAREGALGCKVLTTDDVDAIARDFEDAVTAVLLKKAQRAIDTHNIHTLIVGGGVSANTYIRETFTSFFEREYPDLAVYFPPRNLSTDNSIMIALAGHSRIASAHMYEAEDNIKADGNLSISNPI